MNAVTGSEMCLEYNEIKAYLHYYAGKFQSKYFEHDELVNEAWMIVHRLDHIEFASQGIRWAMLSYIRKERGKVNKGSSKAFICSIEDKAGLYTNLIKDVIEDPKNFNQSIEDSDFIVILLSKSGLRIDERILIDQIYFRGWTQRKVAQLRGCTPEAIRQKFNKILKKITRVAMREVA